MGSILILSGPIGSGKTTVAKALLENAIPPTAYIEGDVFWSFLAKPPPSARQRSFPTIMRAMFRSASALAGDGWDVILDFSIPPPFAAGAAARVPELDVRYVELHASLEICAARSASRAEGAIADYRPYADFFDAFNADPRFVVWTDDADPKSAAAAIRDGLAAGRFRLATIDA